VCTGSLVHTRMYTASPEGNAQVYHFLQVEPLAQICRALFRRIARREIEAFTSADVAADVIYRAMVTEAVAQG
jgi:hypothetical protein